MEGHPRVRHLSHDAKHQQGCAWSWHAHPQSNTAVVWVEGRQAGGEEKPRSNEVCMQGHEFWALPSTIERVPEAGEQERKCAGECSRGMWAWLSHGKGRPEAGSKRRQGQEAPVRSVLVLLLGGFSKSTTSSLTKPEP